MRFEQLALVAVCALLVTATLPTALAANQEVTLTVTVVDREGAPVSDAEVIAEWAGGSAADTTRSNGQVLIDVPKGSTVSISVDDDRYIRNDPYVIESAAGGEVTVGVVERGSASIYVGDDDGPVVGASVTVTQDGDVVAKGKTNENGAFTTGDVERGTYGLRIEKSGYYVLDRSLDVKGDQFWMLELDSGTVPVEVRVVDDHFEDPRPVADAQVHVGDHASGNTSEDGRFTASVPVNAEHELRVSKPGYESVSRTLSVDEDETTATVDIRRTPSLSLMVANSKTVVGQTVIVTVTDEYGERVSGAAVRIDGERVGETNDEGVARIPIEEAGPRRIVVAADGVTSNAVVVEGVRDSGSSPNGDDGAASADVPNETATDGPKATEGAGPGFTGGATLLAAALALGAAVGRRARL
ncbi:carboxypeptidase regulatory-like domain-containing protein [Halomarina pelagica]|uniref:carboxypeptidase regulatory-like domain-containing protein n=1 Tax=Halomarina pelagica TaxID=2961599 RepID=UPI0020C41513|nr:carboxypeptidase regulatory-like domain-containing protein [Halomarina sp. BND7]